MLVATVIGAADRLPGEVLGSSLASLKRDLDFRGFCVPLPHLADARRDGSAEVSGYRVSVQEVSSGEALVRALQNVAAGVEKHPHGRELGRAGRAPQYARAALGALMADRRFRARWNANRAWRALDADALHLSDETVAAWRNLGVALGRR